MSTPALRKNYLFYLFLFFQLFRINSFADDKVNSDIKKLEYYLSTQDIFDQVTSKWEFHNEDMVLHGIPFLIYGMNPDIVHHLEKFVRSTIRKGLSKLLTINPNLALKSIAQLERRVFFISVYSPGKNALAITYPSRWDVFDKRIIVGHKISVSISYKFDPDRINRFTIKQGFETQIGPIEFAENAIFHEFLHAMGIDNLSPLEHSKSVELLGFSIFGSLKRFDDIVFSCSNLVFPTDWSHQFRIRRNYENRKLDVPIVQESCATCYNALKNTQDKSIPQECQRYEKF